MTEPAQARALTRWGVLALTVVVAQLAVGSVLAAGLVRDRRLFELFSSRAAGGGIGDAIDEAGRTVTVAGIAYAVLTISLLLTLGLFCRSATVLAQQRGLVGLRHGRGIALTGWFIPVALLWLPPQVVRGLWRASADEDDVEPSLRLIGAWWTAVLASLFATRLLGLSTSPAAVVVTWLLQVAGLGLTAVVLSQLLSRFRRRVGQGPAQRPTRSTTATATAVAIVMTAGLVTVSRAEAEVPEDLRAAARSADVVVSPEGEQRPFPGLGAELPRLPDYALLGGSSGTYSVEQVRDFYSKDGPVDSLLDGGRYVDGYVASYRDPLPMGHEARLEVIKWSSSETALDWHTADENTAGPIGLAIPEVRSAKVEAGSQDLIYVGWPMGDLTFALYLIRDGGEPDIEVAREIVRAMRASSMS